MSILFNQTRYVISVDACLESESIHSLPLLSDSGLVLVFTATSARYDEIHYLNSFR